MSGAVSKPEDETVITGRPVNWVKTTLPWAPDTLSWAVKRMPLVTLPAVGAIWTSLVGGEDEEALIVKVKLQVPISPEASFSVPLAL